MDSIKCKIPINTNIFGEFKRGKRLKSATLYFWLRSMSFFDGEKEYTSFYNGKPFTVRFIHDLFGFGVNSITSLLDNLYNNNLIELDKVNKRYIFRTEFENGEWVFIHQEDLRSLLDKYKNSDIILIYGFLKAKYSIFKDKYKFCDIELNSYLGYQSSTYTKISSNCLESLKNDGYIDYEKCNGDTSLYNFARYKKLLFVKN